MSSFLNRLEYLCPPLIQGLRSRIKASPVGYRLARGAFWSLTGTVLSRGLGLLSGILVGRLLGKHGFGELGMIQSTVGLFGTVAGFGMGTMATRNVAELRLKDPLKAGRVIALSSATAWLTSAGMALLLIIFAPWLAKHTLAAPQLTGLLRVGALLLLLNGVNGAQTGALAGFEAFKSISRINLYTGLLSFPLMLVGAWFWGVTGAVWAYVANYAFNCWMNWHALRQEANKSGIVLTYDGCLQESGLFWRFNLPTVINSILYSFTIWACGAMVVQQASGYGGMGVFNAAKRFAELPELFFGMLMVPVLPVLSETFGRKDMAAYGKTLVMGFLVGTLIIVPVSLLQIAVPWLTLLPYGADYQGGESIVRWLVLGSVAYSLVWPVNNILISMGRMWLLVAQVVLYMVLYLVLGRWLIPRHGAAGFAMAGTLAFTLSNLPCVVFLFLKLGDTMRRAKWISMVLVAGGLVFFCGNLPASWCRTFTLAAGLVSAAVYGVWRLVAAREYWNKSSGQPGNSSKP